MDALLASCTVQMKKELPERIIGRLKAYSAGPYVTGMYRYSVLLVYYKLRGNSILALLKCVPFAVCYAHKSTSFNSMHINRVKNGSFVTTLWLTCFDD